MAGVGQRGRSLSENPFHSPLPPLLARAVQGPLGVDLMVWKISF